MTDILIVPSRICVTLVLSKSIFIFKPVSTSIVNLAADSVILPKTVQKANLSSQDIIIGNLVKQLATYKKINRQSVEHFVHDCCDLDIMT